MVSLLHRGCLSASAHCQSDAVVDYIVLVHGSMRMSERISNSGKPGMEMLTIFLRQD
jgi:hypothetical protein